LPARSPSRAIGDRTVRNRGAATPDFAAREPWRRVDRDDAEERAQARGGFHSVPAPQWLFELP